MKKKQQQKKRTQSFPRYASYRNTVPAIKGTAKESKPTGDSIENIGLEAAFVELLLVELSEPLPLVELSEPLVLAELPEPLVVVAVFMSKVIEDNVWVYSPPSTLSNSDNHELRSEEEMVFPKVVLLDRKTVALPSDPKITPPFMTASGVLSR